MAKRCKILKLDNTVTREEKNKKKKEREKSNLRNQKN